MYLYDSSYILILIGAVISMLASAGVRSAYQKYAKVRSASGLTGAEAARRILQSQGIYEVVVEPVAGELTDHFDPRSRVLRLSQSTYNSTSIAAIGVAAHECGHAVQHSVNYFPLNLRTAIVPVANFGSSFSWVLLLFGIFLGSAMGSWMIELGVLLFSSVVLFHLVTLPVEFNASRRGMTLLQECGIMSREEASGTAKVLRAAAFTYVAAVISSVLQMLRLIMIANRNKRR